MMEDNFSCNFIENLEIDIFALEKMKNLNLFVIIAWNKEEYFKPKKTILFNLHYTKNSI